LKIPPYERTYIGAKENRATRYNHKSRSDCPPDRSPWTCCEVAATRKSSERYIVTRCGTASSRHMLIPSQPDKDTPCLPPRTPASCRNPEHAAGTEVNVAILQVLQFERREQSLRRSNCAPLRVSLGRLRRDMIGIARLTVCLRAVPVESRDCRRCRRRRLPLIQGRRWSVRSVVYTTWAFCLQRGGS